MEKILKIFKKYTNWIQKTFHIPDKIMKRSIKIIWAFNILKTIFWIILFGVVVYHFFVE